MGKNEGQNGRSRSSVRSNKEGPDSMGKNAALNRQNLILEGKIGHDDKGSLNYRLANKLVLRYKNVLS